MKQMKVDPTLGEEVRKHLCNVGVETPMVANDLDKQTIRNDISFHFGEIMKRLSLDLSDDSLIGTPDRVAKMYVDEIFEGLDYANFPKATTTLNSMQYDQMLIERKIKVRSLCEHHFVPIDGECFVAYIPNEKIIGLSKINRIVNFFARRPQVQERLCEQIYHALSYVLGTDNVAVLIKASHMCVKLRGVEDSESDTITAKLGGAFFRPAARNEFYKMIEL